MGVLDKVKSIKGRRVPRKLSVKSAINLTPNMRRVTLSGDALANFPENSEGAYIKLVFENPEQAKPVMRTYTVSAQRSEANEIDVDFMLHAGTDGKAHGVAASWSIIAKSGDSISLFGPGPATFINVEANCFILAADMTALPALTANLKLLPDSAVGMVFIEVLSGADKQQLEKPENVELHWVINDKPGAEESPLFHALAQTELPEGKLAAWVACEFKAMKKIRQHLKSNHNIEKTHLYISSYWKRGDTEEQHKVAKQVDAKEPDS